jgi:hypothetical protein
VLAPLTFQLHTAAPAGCLVPTCAHVWQRLCADALREPLPHVSCTRRQNRALHPAPRHVQVLKREGGRCRSPDKHAVATLSGTATSGSARVHYQASEVADLPPRLRALFEDNKVGGSWVEWLACMLPASPNH